MFLLMTSSDLTDLETRDTRNGLHTMYLGIYQSTTRVHTTQAKKEGTQHSFSLMIILSKNWSICWYTIFSLALPCSSLCSRYLPCGRLYTWSHWF